MEEILVLGIAGLGGFLVGMGTWFPFKFFLNKAVSKKRQTTALLKELSLTEQEHMEQPQQNPSAYSFRPQTGYGYGTTTNTENLTAKWVAPVGPPQNYAIASELYGGFSIAAENQPAVSGSRDKTAASLVPRWDAPESDDLEDTP